MQIIAPASTTVRNKNLLIVLLCSVFLVLFIYDGWYAWPRKNDEKIKYVLTEKRANLVAEDIALLEAWKSYNESTPPTRAMVWETLKKNNLSDGWKTDLDIQVQKYIAFGLIPLVGAALWWFMHCQKRRAIATESYLSPAAGVEIPWEKITVIDNTRWERSGIVDITYMDKDGKEQQAKLDDYETARDPLIEILEYMADHAKNAKHLPEEAATDEAAPKS